MNEDYVSEYIISLLRCLKHGLVHDKSVSLCNTAHTGIWLSVIKVHVIDMDYLWSIYVFIHSLCFLPVNSL